MSSYTGIYDINSDKRTSTSASAPKNVRGEEKKKK